MKEYIRIVRAVQPQTSRVQIEIGKEWKINRKSKFVWIQKTLFSWLKKLGCEFKKYREEVRIKTFTLDLRHMPSEVSDEVQRIEHRGQGVEMIVVGHNVYKHLIDNHLKLDCAIVPPIRFMGHQIRLEPKLQGFLVLTKVNRF